MEPKPNILKTYSRKPIRRNSSVDVFDALLAENICKRKEAQLKKKRPKKKLIRIKDLPPPDENHHLLNEESIHVNWKPDDTFDRLKESFYQSKIKAEVETKNGIIFTTSIHTPIIHKTIKSETSSEMEGNHKKEKTLDKQVSVSLLVENVPLFPNYQEPSGLSSSSDFMAPPVQNKRAPKLNETSYEALFTNTFREAEVKMLHVASTPAIVSSTPYKQTPLVDETISPILNASANNALEESLQEIKKWNVKPPDFEENLCNTPKVKKHKAVKLDRQHDKKIVKKKNLLSAFTPNRAMKFTSKSLEPKETPIADAKKHEPKRFSAREATLGFPREKLVNKQEKLKRLEVIINIMEGSLGRIYAKRNESPEKVIFLRGREVRVDSRKLKKTDLGISTEKSSSNVNINDSDDLESKSRSSAPKSSQQLNSPSSTRNSSASLAPKRNSTRRNSAFEPLIDELDSCSVQRSSLKEESYVNDPVSINLSKINSRRKTVTCGAPENDKVSNQRTRHTISYMNMTDECKINDRLAENSILSVAKGIDDSNSGNESKCKKLLTRHTISNKSSASDANESSFRQSNTSCVYNIQTENKTKKLLTRHTISSTSNASGTVNENKLTRYTVSCTSNKTEDESRINNQFAQNNTSDVSNLNTSNRSIDGETRSCHDLTKPLSVLLSSHLEFEKSSMSSGAASADFESSDIVPNTPTRGVNLRRKVKALQHSTTRSSTDPQSEEINSSDDDCVEFVQEEEDYSYETKMVAIGVKTEASSFDNNRRIIESLAKYVTQDKKANYSISADHSYSKVIEYFEDKDVVVISSDEESGSDEENVIQEDLNIKDNVSDIQKENALEEAVHSLFKDDGNDVENAVQEDSEIQPKAKNSILSLDSISISSYEDDENNDNQENTQDLDKKNVLSVIQINNTTAGTNLDSILETDKITPPATLASSAREEGDDKFNESLTVSFKKPSSLHLKPGKPWRRSLLTIRKSFIVLDPNQCLAVTGGICTCTKCEQKETSMRASERRHTIKIVPETPDAVRLDITEFKTYASLNIGTAYVPNAAKDPLYPERSIGEPTLVRASSIHESIVSCTVTARDLVLRRCGQVEPIPFTECYPSLLLKNCFKIGEGLYGEVFLFKAPDGGSRVMKVIPIEGEQMVNGEHQKKFEDIISEIVIAMELSNLRDDKKNRTEGFSKVERIRCVQGRYPDRLLELWELFDEDRGSENDSPEMFKDDQLYIVLELANGGKDMEAFVFNNASQAYALFRQTACALAVAESSLQFEHRDLHWGNLLISQTDKSKQLTYCLDGREFSIPTNGIQVSIIDFTLSRITYDGVTIFNDLSSDPDLFTATGDYQFEIYKLMQKRNTNEWQHFEPYSNVLWMHYVADKMITALRYKNKSAKVHKEALANLRSLKRRILQYVSVKDMVENEFFS